MPWLTPDELPEDDACRPLFIPNNAEMLANVSGAILELTREWNWEKFGTVEPSVVAERMQLMMERYYEDMCVGGDVPAPFWDDADGEDADDQASAETQIWYEELAHWFLAGFLATTFTPAAGIFYLTYLRPLRIAFLARDWGAIAEILVDGELWDTVDTFSATPLVIDYEFDIPVSEGLTASDVENHEIVIRHSGEANPSATPLSEGTSISVIRDYIGRDKSLIRRLNPDDGVFEISIDGGESWIIDPSGDPRNTVLLPPLTGVDVSCRAASSIVYLLQEHYNNVFTAIDLGGSAISLAAYSIGAARFLLYSTNFLLPIWLEAISFMVSTTTTVLEANLTTETWDKLRCIFNLLVDPETGEFPQDNLPRLYNALYEELPFLAATLIDWFVDVAGSGGLSNMALQDADPSPGCACCPSGLVNYVEPFTGGLRWRTFLGFAPPAFRISRGVWDGSVGRTAPGCVAGTQPADGGATRWAYATVDFGTECRFRGGNFWFRSASAVGGTPANKFWIWYDENFVELGRLGGLTGIGTTWQQWTSPADVSGVRYVSVGVSINGTGNQIYLDDVNVQWQP